MNLTEFLTAYYFHEGENKGREMQYLPKQLQDACLNIYLTPSSSVSLWTLFLIIASDFWIYTRVGVQFLPKFAL